MSYKVKLEKFEGPLDLLLQLIENADLDITEVSLSQVADQFMQYLVEIENKNPEELADFLVAASRLLLIKSRILLPNLHIEDETEALELEIQLKIYKEYYEATKKIETILAEKKVLFVRDKILFDKDIMFNPPENLSAEKIKKIFLEVLKEIEPIIQLPKKSILKAISIKEKIEQIKKKILSNMNLSFSDLIKESKTRTEVIVAFLGVLELVKQRTVIVKQEEVFKEIIIQGCDLKTDVYDQK
ncbi:MAG: segregation/condensation protein A [Patescibacteria group bacterium]